MRTAAIIVAAGKGTRAGGPEPKQWQQIAGKRVLDHTITLFAHNPRVDEIVVVVSPEDLDRVPPQAGVTVTPGGASRAASVQNGLRATKASHVLIHDAARCTCPKEVIDATLDALLHWDGAAPALPVTDALWRGTDAMVSAVQPRDGLFRAQTPQGFRRDAILAAHDTGDASAADDVALAIAAGIDVTIVAGDERNLKITTPGHFARAEALLKKDSPMDIRLGNGFDVHRFGPGDHVVLCGIKLPHDRGLQGHSDADVALHTVTDAIYGALAEGDIGRHFPPSDPQWKGADSAVFLRHACALAREKSYRINNVDCTLICEYPKITPHAPAMMENMATLMALREDQVSVKATTSERLGFTGRGEGIACIATVTLIGEAK